MAGTQRSRYYCSVSHRPWLLLLNELYTIKNILVMFIMFIYIYISLYSIGYIIMLTMCLNKMISYLILSCQTYLDPLIKFERKRIMTYSLYDAHTEPFFRQLDILNFRKLVIHRIALLMFK